MNKHWAVFIQNDSDKKEFITKLLGKDQPTIFKHLAERKGMLFSKSAVRKYIATETKHGNSRLTKAGEQRLN